ncbi:MAG: crossover junction endodeoxyribonuclease RuvC [Bacteroidetes bacterium]|nr:crossover junction endodeoxyribonuclease RuvC [Bacteroidota bacterium]
MPNDRIILGIDPGTTIMGYGLIHHKGNKIDLITLGILKLNRFSSHELRLKKIFDRILSLINEFHPDEMAIESPFYGKNIQSMLKLGRAQGVAMAAALYKDIPIFEYSPRKIKQSITGKGNSSKEQVAAILMRLMELQDPPEYLDATDALGVAVCHYFQGSHTVSEKKYTGWNAFLQDNPHRIKSS